ncbi:MAG: acyl-CoA thioesterase [Brevinematales bacterium]|nr:acyl-CoA thioesterase [Brevinematales bacterium]
MTEEFTLSNRFVVMPREANHYGNVHGGEIMHAADNLAYMIASSYSRKNVVTARVNEINFKSPVKIGDMVEMDGRITRVGRTSMDVEICIRAEKLRTGEKFEVADARFTMVAVDSGGRPVPVKDDEGIERGAV